MNAAIPERRPVTEEISGVIERVTFHNDENGFCVLRVKTQGHREETTVVGSLPSVTAGEWLAAEGQWVRDKEHGLQFKASTMKTVPPTTYSNLVGIYATFGNYEKALQEAQQALRLDPEDGDNYHDVAYLFMCLNRLDEAEAALKQAEERKLEGEDLLTDRYTLAFLRGDAEGMARVVASAADKPFLAFSMQTATEAYYGRLRKARDLLRRAVESAKQEGAVDRAAVLLADAGTRAAYLGDMQQARADADDGLRLAATREAQYETSLALALAGDTGHAEKITAQLNKSFPLDTWVQLYYLPTTRAVVALSRKNPAEAVELLTSMSPHELGAPGLVPIYERGRAYLMLRNGNAAATEFQKVIDRPGIVQTHPVGALTRLGLARACALSGDAAKARTAYQDFLTLWKDADPDIPILYSDPEREIRSRFLAEISTAVAARCSCANLVSATADELFC